MATLVSAPLEERLAYLANRPLGVRIRCRRVLVPHDQTVEDVTKLEAAVARAEVDATEGVADARFDHEGVPDSDRVVGVFVGMGAADDVDRRAVLRRLHRPLQPDLRDRDDDIGASLPCSPCGPFEEGWVLPEAVLPLVEFRRHAIDVNVRHADDSDIEFARRLDRIRVVDAVVARLVVEVVREDRRVERVEEVGRLPVLGALGPEVPVPRDVHVRVEVLVYGFYHRLPEGVRRVCAPVERISTHEREHVVVSLP